MKHLTLLLLFLFSPLHLAAFSIDNAIVPEEKILSGGPPKDGIPALLNPTFLLANEAEFLKDHDKVIGIEIGGEAKSYPIKILNWHEAVNDTLGGQDIVVTFWPLTQTGAVFSRKINGETYTFGISGRLYKSNVLLYDHQTESLWSQLMEKAISGPLVNMSLTKLPAKRMKWKSWRKKHPGTLVLSDQTGYNRDYTIDPYAGYYRIGSLMFPVGNVRKDLAVKERILGIVIDGNAKAYPLKVLIENSGIVTDRIGETTIRIHISQEKEITALLDANDTPLPHIFSYWFAWQAFHPNTTIYKRK